MTDDAERTLANNTKLTPDLQERLVALLGRGATRRAACAACGIHESTLRLWCRRAEGAEPEKPPTVELIALIAAIREAEALAEIEACDIVLGAAREGDWRAASWWLERSRGDDWGNRVKQEIKADITGEQKHGVIVLGALAPIVPGQCLPEDEPNTG